jgi:hypothetical protein
MKTIITILAMFVTISFGQLFPVLPQSAQAAIEKVTQNPAVKSWIIDYTRSPQDPGVNRFQCPSNLVIKEITRLMSLYPTGSIVCIKPTNT